MSTAALSERVCRNLLQKGRVDARQIDQARRTQSFFGGQLESHLLKLGFVDEGSLGEALTAEAGVSYASLEQLRAVPQDALVCIPAEMAQRLGVCPFRVDDRRLLVAMLNPKDPRSIAEIQHFSGRTVEPWITCEYRLYQALERHYRIRGHGTKAISLAPPSEAFRAIEASPAASTPTSPLGSVTPEVGLDGRPIDADLGWDDVLDAGPPQPDPSRDVGMAPASDAQTWPQASEARYQGDFGASRAPAPEESAPFSRADGFSKDTPVSSRTFHDDRFEVLDRGLDAARDRDAISACLLRFCAPLASRVALFAVAKARVRGVAGRGPGFETESLLSVSIPFETGSIFDSALKSRDFFFGSVPPLPANRDIYTLLGGKLPATALIVPVLVKERTAALLYVDDEQRPITRPDIPGMLRAAAKAGLAFEILLLRNKLREI